MISEAMMGVTAFKAALDITKGLKDIDDRTRRNEAVIELQEKILGAQAVQAVLVQEVSQLEKEVASLKAWDTDKQRYELKDLGRGFFTFIPKHGMENGEPPHAICANCYQMGFKSFLQNSGHPTIHDRSWDCPACKTKIKNTSNDVGTLIEKSRMALNPPTLSAEVAVPRSGGNVPL
jgi:hypothetical protein